MGAEPGGRGSRGADLARAESGERALTGFGDGGVEIGAGWRPVGLAAGVGWDSV